jgi:class 3 adenylate cyclase
MGIIDRIPRYTSEAAQPDQNNNFGEDMADDLHLNPLTGHGEFDRLIAEFSELRDAEAMESARQAVWEKFGVEGAVFISDMASFSSTSRKIGVCHFLKLIHRARQMIAPLIAQNNGLLLKCDADNCYAFFESTDDAIRASFDINAELFRHNDEFSLHEQIYLSVGIDYGRVLLIGDKEFFGDPVNTASKLGEDLAIKAETLVTKRALEHATLTIPETAERIVARISEIEIKYVRLPMTEIERDELE